MKREAFDPGIDRARKSGLLQADEIRKNVVSSEQIVNILQQNCVSGTDTASNCDNIQNDSGNAQIPLTDCDSGKKVTENVTATTDCDTRSNFVRKPGQSSLPGTSVRHMAQKSRSMTSMQSAQNKENQTGSNVEGNSPAIREGLKRSFSTADQQKLETRYRHHLF